MIADLDIPAAVAACSAGDAAGIAAAGARLGLALDPEITSRIKLLLRGNVGWEVALALVVQASVEPSGIAMREVREASRGLWGKDFCLAVRVGDQVVLGVGHAPNLPMRIGEVWDELKPWFKDLRKNRARAEAWAATKAKDRLSIGLGPAPARTGVGGSGGEAELLRKIVADPDDDEPRLVLADLLLERGDVRGELIRVQCELAGIPKRYGVQNRQRDRLEERAKRLVSQYGERIAGDVARTARAYVIDRGFVDRITIDAGGFRKHGERLLREHPIRVVHVRPLSHDTAAKLVKAPALPQVRELSFDTGDVNFERVIPIAALAEAPRLERLRKLDFRALAASADDWQRALEGLDAPALEEISFSWGQIAPSVLVGLGANAHLRKLRVLDLGETAPLGRHRRRGGPEDWTRSLELLGRLPNFAGLTRLSLSSTTTGIDATSVGLWLAGPNARAIEELDLSCLWHADDDFAAALARAPLGALRLLELSNTDVGPPGVRAILRSKTLRSLHHLRLWMGDAEDTARIAEMALELPSSHPLQVLWMDRRSLEPALAKRLAARFPAGDDDG